MKMALRLAVALALAGAIAWGAGALYFSGPFGEGVRELLAGLWTAASVSAFVLLRNRRRTLIGFGIAFAALLAWWLSISPSNQRAWQPEMAVTPWATIEGEQVTLHGVRNLDYRTETDFTPRWETRSYDLREIDSLDLIAVYWMGPAIAHTFVSFGFGGKDFVAVSIETRREKGERYSTLGGFFKQYELIYVVGDERDLIRVRTSLREPEEDVYVYRVRARREGIRRLFLEYLRDMNALRDEPRFYHTLTTNCTTQLFVNTQVAPRRLPLSWKVLASGYFPEYIYDLGGLDITRPFPELQKLALVNPRANAAGVDPMFSQRIREGIPIPPPLP